MYSKKSREGGSSQQPGVRLPGLALWERRHPGVRATGVRLIGLALLAALVASGTWAAETVPEGLPHRPGIRLVCVDDAASPSATVQSYNQKVVANPYGLFMAYVHSRNEEDTTYTWRLLRSTDGGDSFSVLFEGRHATCPPILETDSKGNIYLMRPDLEDHDAYLYRFMAEKQFRGPAISRMAGEGRDKCAMVMDARGERLFYLSQRGRLAVIGLDGNVLDTYRVLQRGDMAGLQYPQLFLTEGGILHAAWTTQRDGRYLYWDIHHMLSGDAGRTWQALDGRSLSLPVAADQEGQATRITLDDEFWVHTWLSSFIVNAGKVHFLYLAQHQRPRQHYVRYDLATGRREIDFQPIFSGGEYAIHGLDGFFARGTGQKNPLLFCTGRDVEGRLVCLVSRDNGDSWRDHARSVQRFNAYAIGGSRVVTSDGIVMGSFTDSKGDTESIERKSQVYFFRIEADAAGEEGGQARSTADTEGRGR
ncbi:MAG: hypothetical protein HYU36_05360 [Planctomycetes bacterium]|nr:hypothetical protein [Planctomycetota bacterium]